MDRKLIPFSDGFYINSKGELFNTKGELRNTYRNGDGYVTANVKRKDGTWSTYGIHRLVGIC